MRRAIVEMAMTSGMASPRAWGQAMTSTVAVRTSASSRSPSSHHQASVIAPRQRRHVEEECSGTVRQRLCA